VYCASAAGWSNTSLTREPLTVHSLSSALTRTASYQMTICAVKHADYLLRRIRHERDPLHAQATALRIEMREIGLRMIRQLDWRDFETLVDLIYARAAVHLFTIATFGSAALSCFPATILEQLRRHSTLTALSCVNRTTNNFCNSSTFSKPAL
jgi:hypothetical protein